MPRFSDDDVLDFQVTEALVARGEADRAAAEETQKQTEFRKSHKDWDPLGERGGG